MNTFKIKNAKILKSERMNKTAAEQKRTSAPKNQMIVKDENGELYVIVWFNYLGSEELDYNHNFIVKETMQGWVVKDVERV